MATAALAVRTNIWAEKLARLYAGDTSLGSDMTPTTFKIGEGGWVDNGSGAEPIDPDPTLTALTAGAGSYTSPSDYIFTKALAGGDVVFSSPTRLAISCFVDTGEANDDGHGNDPEFFEIGVFDADGVMLAYSTFAKEIKNNTKSLLHVIYVDF